ncbi:MAG: SAM-dependent methyltransferase, partial [Clostridia bacterium]|nr:SAM-dependent methyltransferase [Clostridia bacterium]
SDRIQLRLASGLDKVSPDEADDIIIAGMGGILISELIEKAQWLKDEEKHLVLQPQSHSETLREYLMKNGYYIEKEEICEDAGRLYCIMSVYFDGKERSYPEKYEYYGEIPSCKSSLAKEYLLRLSDRFVRDAGNMRCADPVRAEELYSIADALNKIAEK